MSNKRRENRSVSSKSHSAVECTFGPTKNSAQKINKWFDMYGRSASIWNIVCDWLGKQLRDCDITMRLSMKTMEVQIKGEQWNKRFRTVNREGGGGICTTSEDLLLSISSPRRRASSNDLGRAYLCIGKILMDSLNPFAKGLLSIFRRVICNDETNRCWPQHTILIFVTKDWLMR